MKIILYLLSLELLHLFIFIGTFELKFLTKIMNAYNLLKNFQLWRFLEGIINNPKVVITFLSFVMFFIGIVILIFIDFFISEKDYEGPDKILKIRNKCDHLSFISTYVVPLIAFSYESWNQVILYIMYLFVLGVIYTKTGQYSTNPTLLLWGFNLYDLEFENGDKYTFISKDILEEKKNVNYVKLDIENKILIGRENK